MPAMIVAPQPLAVEEGAKVLMKGGNAFDAAITCALVQCVLSPHSCGIGGYVIANLHRAGEKGSIGLDAQALAGEKTSAEMWVDKVIRPDPDGWGFFLEGSVNTLGYTSICTPGTIKAFGTILRDFGTYSFAEAAAPAIVAAEEGWQLEERQANMWKMVGPSPEWVTALIQLQSNAEAGRIYLQPNGEPYEIGALMRNPDYGATLRHLGKHGPEDFYTGELAARIAADLEKNGSFVTANDLANYQLQETPPNVGTFHDYTVTSSGPPHGGATLIAILNILEGYDLQAMGHNSPDYIYTVAMAMKAAFADRNPHMADPYHEEVPVEWMISKERAQYWRDQINSGAEISAAFDVGDTPSTTHVSVVDGAGNCVALTHSLGSSSGVITPGLGFMYNNSMINFHPLPGHPNSIKPGKGRTTGMAPTIIYKDDKPVLVLGSPGATRIITSNVQVILNSLVFGMSITEAVHAARFDCQISDIRCHARIPEYVCAEVRKRHPIRRLPRSHGGFALVEAIHIDPITGQLTGAADTGTDGMALLV
ncbi:MAG: gamma-glutamyltransferase [Anaerolineales bacterium]|nr:gamma-glutamyltransferase [Anaerolineales bacterium]